MFNRNDHVMIVEKWGESMKIKEMLKDGKLPLSKDMLVDEFKQLGLKSNDKVMVHSSLSSFGYVIDGARAIIDAIIEVVGEDGLILMPGHSSWNSDPLEWTNPPMPKEWTEHIANSILPYDPQKSAIDFVGAIPIAFSKYNGVLRTNHPTVSFLMYGNYIGWENQPLNYPLGVDSQLMKLFEEDGKVLMLGTDYSNVTALHLSEYLSDKVKEEVNKSKVLIDNTPEWVSIIEKEAQCEFFNLIGDIYERDRFYSERMIGYSKCKLVDVRELVTLGKAFFDHNKLKVETVKTSEVFLTSTTLDKELFVEISNSPEKYRGVYGFKYNGKYYIEKGLEYLYYHHKKGIKKFDLFLIDYEDEYKEKMAGKNLELMRSGLTVVSDLK